MSRPNDPFDFDSAAARHELVTALQILTLTAELLAIELRDATRTAEQVQERSRALESAMQRVTLGAQRVPTRQVSGNGGSAQTLAQAEPLRTIRAFATFITRHALHTDVKRDVLAEYVDGLHTRACELIARIDESSDH